MTRVQLMESAQNANWIKMDKINPAVLKKGGNVGDQMLYKRPESAVLQKKGLWSLCWPCPSAGSLPPETTIEHLSAAVVCSLSKYVR